MTRKPPKITATFDRRTLRDLAGARSFARGEDYFAKGRIHSLSTDGQLVTATVQGAQAYRVELRMDVAKLDYSCTCPVGRDGEIVVSFHEDSGDHEEDA